MKRILGLDLGTNSIGWALVENDFDNKEGKIEEIGSRIIPMSQDILGNFEAGQSHSQTAERTGYRGTRRLYQRDNLRRERLHRVLNILGFLPEHYKKEIDFKKKFGQFKKEVKLNYRQRNNGKYEFIFMDSYKEMVEDFRKTQPQLFFKKKNGEEAKIPYDWTLYYLRKKALKDKISKQELAWIILNFNQKRGYYQLRGDELSQEEDNKDEKYYKLTVKEITPTEDQSDKGIWYEVRFEENDLVYRRQSKEPLNDWIGTEKEFIVTTKIDKEGNPKYSFRAPKEDDWGLVKKKTEQELESYINNDFNNKSVGSFIYEVLLQKPQQKIRGKLIKTIERKYYRKELDAILNKQISLYPELQDNKLYDECINELYKHNDARKRNIANEGFKHLFVEDIIFYQRPLKSQKGTIGGCQYEKHPMRDKDGKLIKDENGEEIRKPIKAISKSHPLFQEFRLWQWLHNLRIYENDGGKDIDVTSELLPTENDWVDLFDFLKETKEIDLPKFLKYFSDKKLIPKQTKPKKGEAPEYTHRWNYPEDKTYPMCETHYNFVSRLKKVNDFDFQNYNNAFETHLWHIIYSVSDAGQYKLALEKFAKKCNLDEDSFLKAFLKYPPFKSDFASYSQKALNKLLPLMRMGKYWSEKAINSQTLERINKILTGEFDEKIKDRVREKAIGLENIEDFKGLPVWLVGYIVYDRHSESEDNNYWNSPEDIDKYLDNFKQHSLRNPIVEQVVLETLRTVRDIWKKYGKGEKGFFNEIHLELGRDMKNPADKRKKMSDRNAENERTNTRIRKILEELIDVGAKPYSPSHQEILKIYEEGVYQNPEKKNKELELADVDKIRSGKSLSDSKKSPSKKDIQRYKLWLEQGYISPYTGQIIQLSKLFSDDYQIEHIIPQSRYFDDSLSNKVICESAVNELKGNKTAYEFIKEKGGSIVDLGNGKKVKVFKWDEYESHCKKYFKKNRHKLKKLLSDEIPEGFINRQLNDSRYISKLVKGLLSNIVREEGEQEPTSKNLIPVTGAITSKLKHDWGLDNKWNKLILPRFKRLNQLTQTKDFTYINEQGVEVPTVPKELKAGFNKKRIDHRHHALDALVIACCTRKHIQYINSLSNEKKKYELQPSLMIKNKEGNYTKYFQLPWQTFPVDAENALETIIISFKQNLRVINKATNKYWKYVKQEDGTYKKQLVKQKGINWAIRKPLHKETFFAKINMPGISKRKIATSTRKDLSEIKSDKILKKISASSIKKILENHLKNYINEKGETDYKRAFSPEEVVNMNQKIVELNGGKSHKPIYKVRIWEESSKFPLSDNPDSPKHKKYVEAAKGTNLYFAIYQDVSGKRTFETVPLNKVIAHQKLQVEENTPMEKRTPIPIDETKREQFLFTLSPNDLVYLPTPEEQENPELVNFSNLSKEQVNRVYLFTDSSGSTANFIPACVSNLLFNISFKEQSKKGIKYSIQNEFGVGSPQSKNQKSTDGKMIKNICWKLNVDRLGNIEYLNYKK